MYYCITFDIYKKKDTKIKIDYGFIPVRLENGEFHSEVSSEIFKNLKEKNGTYFKQVRKNGNFYYQTIMKGDEDFQKAEKELVPKVEKIILKKIIFKFKFKKFLKERVKRILK